MPLEDEDLRHFMAAEGYLELGMPWEANEEIERIDPDVRQVPEALEVRLEIYRATARWEAMQTMAGSLARHDPAEPRWALSLAYATRRRLESIAATRVILMEALERISAAQLRHSPIANWPN